MFSLPQPPWNKLGRELESRCRKALYDFQMLEGVKKVAVALSGGKDSLSLLFLLLAIRGRGFPLFDLVAVHVSGEFSCGAGVNEGYLRAICNGFKVPFISRSSTISPENLECYSCSRDRRSLIFQAAKEVGATTVAFGHHRDDSIQTLLLNLLHKGEFAGNLAKLPMYRYGVTLIRPLLYIEETSIYRFAEQYGFIRTTCQCPVGQTSKRKDVERLLREMEKVFPHARRNLARGSLLQGTKKALEKPREN